MEILFDFVYLFTILIAAAFLYINSKAGSVRVQYAQMALVLAVGDAFHLLPRVYMLLSRTDRNLTVPLGIGKFVASITMTLFYLFLWEIGKTHYAFDISSVLSTIVYGLAILRILLCFPPQNGWTREEPPIKWAIARNIPFLLLGMIVMVLYMIGAFQKGGSLSFVWLAILISFACYLPVVLFSKKNPKIGMLMLPKSCAYAAIILMGLSLN